jgi:peptide/nickel transport system permease protein
MGRYVVRRTLAGLLLLFAMTILTFALFRLIPMPAGCLIVPCGPGSHSTDADIAAAEHKLGADRSVPVQYADFVWRIVRHGSFGASWIHGSIDHALRAAAPKTISILFGGVVFLFALAIPLGVLSAVHAHRPLDRIILVLTVFGVAVHPFLVGLFLTKGLVEYTHIAPYAQYCHPIAPGAPSEVPGALPIEQCVGVPAWAYHMVLPWLTFALIFLPLYTRMIRARVLETMEANHVSAARAKGASEARVIRSHVLRPALLPLVTMVGLDLGAALLVSMYIEKMFGIDGFGALMIDTVAGGGATFGYDLPMIASIFFVFAAAAILVNLVVDVLYSWLDPRVRLA